MFWRKRAGSSRLPLLLSLHHRLATARAMNHGVPPFPETVSYVTRVLQNLNLERRQGGLHSFTLTQQTPQSERRSSAPNFDAIRQFQETIARESGREGSASESEAEPSSQPVESN